LAVLVLVAGLALGGCERERPTFRADLPPCPARMVQLGRACIDRHEARIVGGRAEPALEAPPAVGIAYAEADRACREAGYRLCTGREWTRACAGAHPRRRLPYGDVWEPHRCNTAEWDDDHASIPVRPSGAHERCVSPEGVFDLSGNVWEWTSEPDATGTLRELRGGGARNAESLAVCEPNERLFLAPDTTEGLLGFRCCTDVRR
jgi:formylglycine-generating enzyme required for sulfatase activity